MKTVFSEETVTELIQRIKQLENASNAKWGKMNSTQMIEHCILSEEMYLGKTHYKRLFIGKIFGKMALKKMVSDDNPLKQNQPTHKNLKTLGKQDIEFLKDKWIKLLSGYENLSNHKSSSFEHPFFGKMNKSELGIAAYKHNDHHLRQFGF